MVRLHVDPKIVRISLVTFPFLEMPDSRYINDGFQVLLELGAVEAV